jgi:hypothetical protein
MADGIFDSGIFDPGIFDTGEEAGVDRTAADSVTVSDSAERTATLVRSLADSVTTSDSVAAIVPPSFQAIVIV